MSSSDSSRKGTTQERLLCRLYGTVFGRAIVNAFISRKWVSVLASLPVRSRLSKGRIQPFIRANQIDMSSYEEEPFRSFNDFFIRKIKPGARPFSNAPEDVVSPCDGLLSAVEISPDMTLTVKGQPYTLATLLRDEEVASSYAGGLALIFRLEVHHYHRYMFSDSGHASPPQRIKGRYHTVHPIGLSSTSVLQENAREWRILHFDHLGDVVQVEVGAMLVGRIVNHKVDEFRRGDEKGYFCFGGSTIIWLLHHEAIHLLDRWVATFEREMPVLQGETIAKSRYLARPLPDSDSVYAMRSRI
ncbi:MAG TPA: phosphatidylserine decarboxylase [Clostridiaceae bacterium]|jgi:phosphatidylserine decarboxylase|nr:phosphatidylserine decarboxylase [Clostridiaceae bacterium]